MTADMEDDEKGKLFVGALSWETTDESLHRYFSRFGKVTDCVVMTNNESGRSRGFGFVTFADPNNVTYILKSGPHNLDGRTIDPKPCNPRSMQKIKKNGVYPKIFLGGLPSNVTETDLRTFFGRYGKVMEVIIMYDQEKKKSRGFGFLSFEDEACVERVTSEHYINLNGKQVEIKKAEPRDVATVNKITNNDTNQWNPPQGSTIRPCPPMNITAMNTPNMMQSYQSWNASQQGYSYGAPNAHGSFPSWSGPPPPGPQVPPPHQWNNFSTTQQTQGFGNYGATGNSGGANWKTWSIPQNSVGNNADVYNRQQTTVGGPPSTTIQQQPQSSGLPPPTGPTKITTDYGGYGTTPYGNFLNEQASFNQQRSTYGNDISQHPLYQTQQNQGKGF